MVAPRELGDPLPLSYTAQARPHSAASVLSGCSHPSSYPRILSHLPLRKPPPATEWQPDSHRPWQEEPWARAQLTLTVRPHQCPHPQQGAEASLPR